MYVFSPQTVNVRPISILDKTRNSYIIYDIDGHNYLQQSQTVEPVPLTEFKVKNMRNVSKQVRGQN